MVSLLDIIGPVMVGPSSSHTAGACRLGLLARCLVGGTPQSGLLQLHGSINTAGEETRQIRVELNPEGLRSYGISPQDVVDALRRENQEVPAGRVVRGATEQVIDRT